jgi:chorismate mutase-like protein
MNASNTGLDDARDEIDRIDDQLHDLLKRRAEVVARVADAKKGTSEAVIRPGREAMILRRLLARHGGPLPRAVIASIWRQMIAAMVRLQGPLSVAVCAPQRSVGYWDLARGHYGLSTPMTLHRSHHVVLRAVDQGESTVGLLPVPQEDEADPWWPSLAAAPASAPRIIARLPFVDLGDGRFEELSALVVATTEADETGADVSLLVVAARTEVSRARLNEYLQDAGLEGGGRSVLRASGNDPEILHLVEISDYVAKKDRRIDHLLALANGDIERVVRIGGYAVPIRH